MKERVGAINMSVANMVLLIVCSLPEIVMSAEPLINYKEAGITVDSAAQLMWQDNDAIREQYRAWPEAQALCQSLTLGGHRDWRVPNIYELTTTVDLISEFPVGDLRAGFMYGVNETGARFWSVTPTIGMEEISAVFMNYHYGYDSDESKRMAWCVRCVRGPELSLERLAQLQAADQLMIRRDSINKFIEQPEYHAAQRAQSKRVWQAFLKKYPNGYYAINAKREIELLGSKLMPFRKR
jgi:Protein of unknown function (DUF1566)